MLKKKVLVIALAVLVIGAGFWLTKRKPSRSGRGGGNQMAEAIQRTIEETVEATGSVVPLNRVEIKPPISGRMEKLLVDEGDDVKAGQILAWMSSSDRAAILDAARAKGIEELKQWEDSYKPTPIIAPLSGVIILRNAVAGQTVDAGTILFAMSDHLVVIAQVDESDIGRVREGMPARITLDAYPEEIILGKVFDVLHEGKNVSNVITYGVKIKPDHVPSFFRSQMTANVNFILKKKEDAIVVPSAAVREGQDGIKQVMVPGPDGKGAPREVKTGIETEDSVEIVSGLQAGEKVLIARSRYTPQRAIQSSPLTMGGRPSSNSGQAPRTRRNGAPSN